MITNVQAVDLLVKKQYQAKVDDGIVIVEYEKGGNASKLFEEVLAQLRKAGYEGSIGVKSVAFLERKGREEMPAKEELPDVQEESVEEELSEGVQMSLFDL